MIEQYELYCLADPYFYDTPNRREADRPDFPQCAKEIPAGWTHQPTDSWMHYAPDDHRLPAQGWKIHVSACLDDAERTLEVVWDYCVANGIPFKFLRSEPVLVMYNSKSAFRGSSGKLVTIYPTDEAQLERLLVELAVPLDGIRGPYVLSDLRYGDGPLFVRYGSFFERHCLSEGGERVLALENGEGQLVPDVRGPTFALPAWVTLPAFLEPHLAARNSVTTTDLPYQIESVLQFSNGGGVYLARDTRTDERVVLKEGRPHAGLDALGRDAVTRVAHERDILERLAGLDVVPELRDYFVLGDHHFLVQEFIDGNSLQRILVQRYPLTRPDCSPATIAEYTEWALDMCDKVDDAVAQLHGRGVVFGDLHPFNILVTADGRLALIDYEVATLVEEHARSALGHPAFMAPADRAGVDSDRYSLACLRLGLFAPQTTMLLPLHRAKVTHLAEVITQTFPVSPEAIQAAVDTIVTPPVNAAPAAPTQFIIGPTSKAAGSDTTGSDATDTATARRADSVGAVPSVPLSELPMPGYAKWDEVRQAMCRAILASATPDRDDRLFPGDIAQFQPGGGINLANGAAGVLYAMAVTGADRMPEHEDWLRKRALTSVNGMGIGFYDGLHGIAHVLDLLGHRQDALDTIDVTTRQNLDTRELGLRAGLAGVGLNLLHFAELTGEPAFTEQAMGIVDIVADRLGGPEDVPEISGGDNAHAGLMYGSSGPALLFMHAYERSGDPALLDRAADALRQDLRRCKLTEDGSMQVNQGWRTLPYLDEGSVGIALVLQRYLAHRQDDDLATALAALQLVTRCGFFVMPGLFTGRAGMIAAVGMRSAADAGPGRTPDPEAVELMRGLSWHALPYGGGLTYPGDQLLRVSMDLATGTAGVLFAIGAALYEQPVCLPFVQPSGSQGA